jgi:hypothetical protein
MAHAAERTVVTVEKLHDGNLLEDPLLAAGTLPGFYVETVAVEPRGAWPLPSPLSALEMTGPSFGGTAERTQRAKAQRFQVTVKVADRTPRSHVNHHQRAVGACDDRPHHLAEQTQI